MNKYLAIYFDPMDGATFTEEFEAADDIAAREKTQSEVLDLKALYKVSAKISVD